MRRYFIILAIFLAVIVRADTRPYNYTGYDSLIHEATDKYFTGVPQSFEWIKAKVYAESAFQPGAKSYVGALGLMQIMPSTAKDLQGTPEMALDPKWAGPDGNSQL